MMTQRVTPLAELTFFPDQISGLIPVWYNPAVKRLHTNLVKAATLLSVLVIITILVAFVGSDFEGDQPWSWGTFNPNSNKFDRLTISKGGVTCERFVKVGNVFPTRTPMHWRFAGFEFDSTGFCEQGPPPWIYYAGWQLRLPFAPLFLLAIILPTRSLYTALKARRSRRAGESRETQRGFEVLPSRKREEDSHL